MKKRRKDRKARKQCRKLTKSTHWPQEVQNYDDGKEQMTISICLIFKTFI